MTRTRTVPLKDLHTDYPGVWENPRMFTGMSDGELEELAETIKAEKKAGHPTGILVPLMVAKIKHPQEGVIDLVFDGQRRKLAGGRVLAANTPIEVIDLIDYAAELTPELADELTLKALKVGTHRRELSSFELAMACQRMRNREKPRQIADIAEAVDRSESWVSRMLKAMSTATPELLDSWKSGKITDEQFKDLAAQKDPERQIADTASVVEARKSGDKAEARSKAKEIVETAKQKKQREKREKAEAKARAKEEKARAKAEAKAKKLEAKAAKKAAKAAAKGQPAPKPDPRDQQEMAWSPPEKSDKPKKPQAPSRVALEEIVALAEARPPTHDIVKGIILGVQHSIGLVELHDLGKPWAAWIARVGGSTGAPKAKPKAKVKAARARRPARSATKRKATKARARTKATKAKR